MHPFLKLFNLVKVSTFFRTVFLSIVRSSKLHIWQQAYVKQLLLPAASRDEMEWNGTAGTSSCLTYACYHMCSFELLKTDGKTVRNM